MMFCPPRSGSQNPHPFLPLGALQFPTGTSTTATMPLATLYRNENVRTTDYGGRWKNQFSFRRETFVFALRRAAGIWQQSLTLKGKCVNKGGEGEEARQRYTERIAWERTLYCMWVYLHHSCLRCEAGVVVGEEAIESPPLFIDRVVTTGGWGPSGKATDWRKHSEEE